MREALSLAYDAHAGQARKSGEPFITHPVEVARILAELRMDYESLVAGGWLSPGNGCTPQAFCHCAENGDSTVTQCVPPTLLHGTVEDGGEGCPHRLPSSGVEPP